MFRGSIITFDKKKFWVFIKVLSLKKKKSIKVTKICKKMVVITPYNIHY